MALQTQLTIPALNTNYVTCWFPLPSSSRSSKAEKAKIYTALESWNLLWSSRKICCNLEESSDLG
jgi:hypothetical protein